jgi:hypothetical protein
MRKAEAKKEVSLRTCEASLIGSAGSYSAKVVNYARIISIGTKFDSNACF